MTFLTPSAATVLIGVATGVAGAWDPEPGIGNWDLETLEAWRRKLRSHLGSATCCRLVVRKREIRARVCCCPPGTLLPAISFTKSRNEEEAEDCKNIEQWLSLSPFAPFSLTCHLMFLSSSSGSSEGQKYSIYAPANMRNLDIEIPPDREILASAWDVQSIKCADKTA